MKSTLEEFGWWHTEYTGLDLDSKLISLARTLGKPIGGRRKSNIVEILKPTISELAKPKSLSRLYSLSGFPLHCDTSHWTKPCRYLIVGCENPGTCNRRTILLDFKNLVFNTKEKELLINSVFLIKNGRSSFYGSILQYSDNFIRFDIGCMEPTDSNSHSAFKLIKEKILQGNKIEIVWKKNKVIVIDNWRLIHGRSIPTNSCSTRELRRVYVV